MEGVFVIDRNFLAGPDVAQREENDVPVQSPSECVWPAGVVYVMSAVPAAAAVETPALIDATDAEDAAMRPAFGFFVWNSLARVLGDFAPALERDSRKTAFAVDHRFRDCKAGSKLEFHGERVRRDCP